MRELTIIANDMRSTFNVGSLFRTAEGLKVAKIYLCGYTPYPKKPDDERLPHLAEKLDRQIHKTALGAKTMVPWEYRADVFDVIKQLQAEGVTVAALEQSPKSLDLTEYEAPDKLALLLGTEVTGLPKELLKAVPLHLEIPMHGRKESFNVVIATAMALFYFRFK